MKKNKGDLETSRMPILGRICNLLTKYFKFTTVILIALIVFIVGIATLKVAALQWTAEVNSGDQQEQDRNVTEESQVLQDNVIRLENEAQSSQSGPSNVEIEITAENDDALSDDDSSNHDDTYVGETETTNDASWGSMKTYMSYKAITNTRSKQYRLQQQAVTDPSTGIRMVGDDYCVAIGSGWGCAIGDRIIVTLHGGKTFNAIVSDFKADAHTNSDNKTTTHDGSVVEFVVDTPSLSTRVRRSGNVGILDQFSGGVVSITKR